MKYFIVAVVIIGSLAFAALNYHFIQTDGGIKVLKKSGMNLEYTFVDARGGNIVKLYLNPTLAKAGFRQFMEKEGIEIKKK